MKLNVLILLLSISICQEIYTDYLVEGQDTIDVFSYQIPVLYDDNKLADAGGKGPVEGTILKNLNDSFRNNGTIWYEEYHTCCSVY